MRSYEIRLPEDAVLALRAYARRRAFEDACDFRWTDAVRQAIASLLSREGEFATAPSGSITIQTN